MLWMQVFTALQLLVQHKWSRRPKWSVSLSEVIAIIGQNSIIMLVQRKNILQLQVRHRDWKLTMYYAVRFVTQVHNRRHSARSAGDKIDVNSFLKISCFFSLLFQSISLTNLQSSHEYTLYLMISVLKKEIQRQLLCETLAGLKKR